MLKMLVSLRESQCLLVGSIIYRNATRYGARIQTLLPDTMLEASDGGISQRRFLAQQSEPTNNHITSAVSRVLEKVPSVWQRCL